MEPFAVIIGRIMDNGLVKWPAHKLPATELLNGSAETY